MRFSPRACWVEKGAAGGAAWTRQGGLAAPPGANALSARPDTCVYNANAMCMPCMHHHASAETGLLGVRGVAGAGQQGHWAMGPNAPLVPSMAVERGQGLVFGRRGRVGGGGSRPKAYPPAGPLVLEVGQVEKGDLTGRERRERRRRFRRRRARRRRWRRGAGRQLWRRTARRRGRRRRGWG